MCQEALVQTSLKWDSFAILGALDLRVIKIVSKYNKTSLEDLVWILLGTCPKAYCCNVTNACSSQ